MMYMYIKLCMDNVYLLFLDVCQLYSNQKAIRVKRLVERKKVYDFIQTENCFDLFLSFYL